jgi:uncharacterized protein YegL
MHFDAYSNDQEEAWPFYIVCDVSASMRNQNGRRQGELTPFEAMEDALNELVDFAEDHVVASDIAHLGLITFADDPEVVWPLRRLSEGVSVGSLPKGMYTNYAKVFSMLSDVVEADLQRLVKSNLTVKRPTVFFITDGKPQVSGGSQPRELWEPPLRRLHSFAAPRTGKQDVAIAVIALGFEGADCEILRTVANEPGVAFIAEAGVASTNELMAQLISSILDSVVNTLIEGDVVFSPPRGLKLCE